MSQPIVRMENVDKYYGDFHVLKNINFTVNEGEIVSFVDQVEVENPH